MSDHELRYDSDAPLGHHAPSGRGTLAGNDGELSGGPSAVARPDDLVDDLHQAVDGCK